MLPESFELWEAGSDHSILWGWSARGLDAVGMPVQYRITGGHSGLFRADASHDLAADGRTPEKWRTIEHPYTRAGSVWSGSVLSGAEAPVEDWVDAIGIADAKGRRVREERGLAGVSLEAAVKRLEHDIVEYRSEEVRCPQGRRASLAPLQEWLDRVLAQAAVRVEVAALARLPETADVAVLRAWGTDEPMTWMPYTIEPRAQHYWRTGLPQTGGPHPTVTTMHSGAQLLSATGDAVLEWSLLEEFITLDAVASLSAAWWVIHVVDTDYALVFPREVMNVLVDIDGDDSVVTISVQPTAQRERFHRHRIRFEKTWGRWLDDGAALTADDLRNGVSEAESELAEVYIGEDRIPPHYDDDELTPEELDDDDGED